MKAMVMCNVNGTTWAINALQLGNTAVGLTCAHYLLCYVVGRNSRTFEKDAMYEMPII
jgi:hypothetical protein